jgi:hypothetical protein
VLLRAISIQLSLTSIANFLLGDRWVFLAARDDRA